MRAEIDREFKDFQSAVNLFIARAPLEKIQEAMTGDTTVVPWLARYRTPLAIARYSHAQNDTKVLRERRQLSEQRLASFQERFDAARETVAELNLSTERREELLKELAGERATMVQAFNLYKKGFSFRDIDDITGIGMQDRARDGRLPPLTRYYGGDILTEDERRARQSKTSRMLVKATEALNAAEKRYRNTRSEPRLLEYRRDFERVALVARLYERGISPLRIRSLTSLSAPEWLACETLPVKLLRVADPIYKRDFKIPTQHTEDSAYVAGAFFARLRLADPDKTLFSAPNRAAADKLRESFTRAFDLEPKPLRQHGGVFLVPISRSAFIEPFKKFIGQTTGNQIIVPRLLIDYSFFRKPFLEGFLSFAGGQVHTTIPRFTLTRSLRGDILNHIAVALSYEGIYPNIHTDSRGSVKLQIDDASEIRRLLNTYPMITDAETRAKALSLMTWEESCLDSLQAYETVLRILQRDYPKGVKLNFEDVRMKGGPLLAPLTLSNAEKQRIKGWRAGLVPKVYLRAKKLAVLETSLRKAQAG